MEPSQPATDAKRILVIDDDKVFLSAMKFLLESRGYCVLVAETGAEALTTLRKDRPDLILLDLDFPPDIGNVGGIFRDGFLILDWARRTGSAEKIPVIIVSSSDPEHYKQRALAAGIPTFFKKPVDNGKLLEAIRNQLHPDEPGFAT